MTWIWKDFVEVYLKNYSSIKLDILDVGGPSGCKKEFSNSLWNYVSTNVKNSPGEKAVVIDKNPYDWTEIETNKFDIVVSKDTLEHIPFFWATMFEIGRVMKNGGLAFIHIPSSGPEHPGNKPPGYYPNKYFDCWRFHADGFSVLCKYLGFHEVEVFTNWGLERMGGSYLVMQKPRFSALELKKFLQRGFYQKLALGDEFMNFSTLKTLEDINAFSFSDDIHTSKIGEQNNLGVCLAWYKKQFHNYHKNKEPYYYYKLGQCYFREGNLDEAINSWETGVQLSIKEQTLSNFYHHGDYDANVPNLYTNLVEAYFKKGDIESAKANYQIVDSLSSPKTKFIYFRLANILAENEQLDDAISTYEKAIDGDPNNLHCYVRKSQVHFKKNQIDLAIDTAKIALKINPNFVLAISKIAHYYESNNQLDQSVLYYKQIMLLQPQNTRVVRKLASLEKDIPRCLASLTPQSFDLANI